MGRVGWGRVEWCGVCVEGGGEGEEEGCLRVWEGGREGVGVGVDVGVGVGVRRREEVCLLAWWVVWWERN